MKKQGLKSMKIAKTRFIRLVGGIVLAGFVLFACSACSGQKTGSEAELVRYVRAKVLYDEGRFADALQLLAKETFIPSQILRGKAFFFSGDRENAEKQLRAVLKKRPSAVEASLYLARVLREKGEGGAAETIVNQILSDDPQNVRALRLAADLQKDKGPEYSAEALAYLDRAVEASMETAMAILERARHKWLLGKDAEALADLAGAKTLFPPDTPALKVVDNLQATIEELLR
ncbi:MAG: tetratricopeptide repeat protein [Spirochaetaceae bacterium]|jgi:tetratricopeptide (TPR) repeat protein|nr:tetratricopeptide repeat protein [Spirochaetaceae bacterium]